MAALKTIYIPLILPLVPCRFQGAKKILMIWKNLCA